VAVAEDNDATKEGVDDAVEYNAEVVMLMVQKLLIQSRRRLIMLLQKMVMQMQTQMTLTLL
jgi:hypothetical protein